MRLLLPSLTTLHSRPFASDVNFTFEPIYSHPPMSISSHTYPTSMSNFKIQPPHQPQDTTSTLVLSFPRSPRRACCRQRVSFVTMPYFNNWTVSEDVRYREIMIRIWLEQKDKSISTHPIWNLVSDVLKLLGVKRSYNECRDYVSTWIYYMPCVAIANNLFKWCAYSFLKFP